jgi:hypothetical protein
MFHSFLLHLVVTCIECYFVLLFVSSLSINMKESALKIIWNFVHSSFRNSPISVLTIQQLLINSSRNKTHLVSLMAQPYEVINVSNGDSQMETKQSKG